MDASKPTRPDVSGPDSVPLHCGSAVQIFGARDVYPRLIDRSQTSTADSSFEMVRYLRERVIKVLWYDGQCRLEPSSTAGPVCVRIQRHSSILTRKRHSPSAYSHLGPAVRSVIREGECLHLHHSSFLSDTPS